MLPIVAALATQGLTLLANAVMAKGQDVIEKKLGVDLGAATQTPEGLVKLRELEVAHEKDLMDFTIAKAELDLKAIELDQKNTAGARDMNTRINESASATELSKNIAAILALVVILGGGALLWTTKEADVRTAVVGLMTLVLGFYFGSSSSSHRKDATIATLSEGKP